VSLLITQVKLQQAWSVLGRMTATHYRKWWQDTDFGVWREVFFRLSLFLAQVYRCGFVQGRRWVIVRNGECHRRNSGILTWICPTTTQLSLNTVGAVALPNIRRELTLSFGMKLPREGRKCSEQYKENLYCLTSELAFLAMR
jgi:hypothetical protein